MGAGGRSGVTVYSGQSEEVAQSSDAPLQPSKEIATLRLMSCAQQGNISKRSRKIAASWVIGADVFSLTAEI